MAKPGKRMKSRKTISAAKLHSPAKKGKGVSVEKTANKPVSRRKSLRVQGKTAKPVPVLDSQKEPRAKPKGEKFESKAAEDHPMSIPTSAAPAEDRPGPGAEAKAGPAQQANGFMHESWLYLSELVRRVPFANRR